MLFHAEFEFVPSGFIGVDIFFVISGYLILGSLIRHTISGELSLKDFWARRIRRLIPAATLVTVSTLVVGWFFYPSDQLHSLSRDSIAAAGYFANWNFLVNEVSYWDVTLVSPFLHYWSLSVEEQFYIFFPLLFGLVLFISRNRKFDLRPHHFQWLLAIFSVISFGALLVASVDESNLYFNTFYRLWEFGIGGLASFAAWKFGTKNSHLKTLLLLMLIGLTLLPNSFQYPGPITALPVLISGLYLGLVDFSSSATKLNWKSLPFKTLHSLGDYSYSVYLWHWPLILYLTYFAYGIDASPYLLKSEQQVFIFVAATFLGYLSYKYVEEPFRRLPINSVNQIKWVAFGASALLLSVSISLVTPFTSFAKPVAPPSHFLNPELSEEVSIPAGDLQELIEGLPGIDLTIGKSLDSLTPSLETMRKTKAAIYEDDCHLEAGKAELQSDCVYGDSNSDTTVYLVGDSHAATWFPALDKVTSELGIKLVPRTKSSCGLFEVQLPGDGVKTSEDCLQYRSLVINELKSVTPDLIVVAQLYNNPGTPIESNEQRDNSNASFKLDLQKQIMDFQLSNLPLLLVADIPHLGFDPNRCLKTQNITDCKTARLAYQSPKNFLIEVATENPNFSFVDLNDFVCSTEYCSATNTEYIMYRDSNHLTADFSAHLSFVWQEVLKFLLR